ncbi:TIGR03086 family metal-binding protein [Saccharopolyspora cebuensis]|uniref:TIGR03086 family metal-binding protein n=1 Tax=Saccharopolyspora cebuensis TaxID=418759 RepID=A0ABV4CIA7_9PSEU
MLDLEPAAVRLRALVPDATGRLTAPTPCAGTSVGDLLDHIMALALAFRYAADKTDTEIVKRPPPEPSVSRLDPSWPSLLPERLDALVAAWREPAAWEGTTWAGGQNFPAAEAGAVALDELVLHGWDLAKALGRGYQVDPASAEAVHAFASAVPDDPEARAGLFGPVVPVPADAPLFDRALGLAGRNPAWTPPDREG